MENAAKALIIAGAILISIILISIGIIVVNQGKEVVDEAGAKMSQQQIQIFNSEFETYANKQRGSTVRTLLSAIIANNATHADDGLVIGVTFTEGSLSKEVDINKISRAQSKVSTTKNYDVVLTYSEVGRVCEIEITKAGGAAIPAPGGPI